MTEKINGWQLENIKTQSTISLKLFAEGINYLFSQDWIDYYFDDKLYKLVDNIDLLQKPFEKGVSYYLGLWLFNDFFSEIKVADLYGEYKLCFLKDFYELIKFHKFHESISLINLENKLNKLDELFNDDFDEHVDYINSDEGNDFLLELFNDCLKEYLQNIKQLQTMYAEEFSDRILHDRQLCFYISNLLLNFQFTDNKEEIKQWVKREYWPQRVKDILKSRDRGKCSSCKADLTIEFDANITIDHMIPIAKGGCNDIVNLQILCDKCNKSKSKNLVDISSSIPRYINRNNNKRRR